MAWPTSDDPKTEFATLRMTKTEAADVDNYAAARGLSRSAAIRDGMSRIIAAEKRRAQASAPSTAKPGGRIDEGAHDE